MARHPDLVPPTADGARSVDQKGGALDAHIFAAVHAFLDPHAVFLARVPAGVGGENERQPVLLLELVVRGYRVLRNADDHRTGPAIIREGIAEAASLGGAARGVVLRVEIEHHLLALELRQGDAARTIGGQCEIGGFFAGLDAHPELSPVCSTTCTAARRAGCSINLRYQPCTCAVAAVISASSRAESNTPAARARVAASASGKASVVGNPSPSNVRSICTWRSSASASSKSRHASGGSTP